MLRYESLPELFSIVRSNSRDLESKVSSGLFDHMYIAQSAFQGAEELLVNLSDPAVRGYFNPVEKSLRGFVQDYIREPWEEGFVKEYEATEALRSGLEELGAVGVELGDETLRYLFLDEGVFEHHMSQLVGTVSYLAGFLGDADQVKEATKGLFLRMLSNLNMSD